MNLAARAASAMAVLAALIFPWAAGVVVVAHLASEGHHHAQPAVHDAKAVELVVHGHHHEPDTPPHQHTLVFSKPAVSTTRLSFILDLAAFGQLAQAPSNPATRPIAAPADLAHGPPLIPRTSLVLRI